MIVDDFRQVIIDLEFGQILFRQVTVILLSLRNTLVHKKQFERKKIQETHRTWPKSFSMIQSGGIKNWLGSPVNK